MNVLLFVGAGASVELGVPAMRAMAHELHLQFGNQRLPSEILDRFSGLLARSDYDIERLIEMVDGIGRGAEQQLELGFKVDEELRRTVGVMRQEAEWYIQHVCERLRERDAQVLWGPALRKMAGHEVCLATTNYDRSIEIASQFSGVEVEDGFESFDGREFAGWRGVSDRYNIQLLKIHGSTDWYHGDDGRVYKLRHPMPLYGKLAVVGEGKEWPRMTSALVLPTREKRVNQQPYPDLITAFRNAARHAEIAIFLGTSLRDPDILDMCRQCAARVPTYFVSRDGPPDGVQVDERLKVVVQMASKFVASTLPRFLSTSNVDEIDNAAKPRGEAGVSVLRSLVAIQDEQLMPGEICQAIEELVDHDVSVDIEMLAPLLRHEDGTVRSYAVALIERSVDHGEVMDLTEQLIRENPDGRLARELEMLETLRGIRQTGNGVLETANSD